MASKYFPLRGKKIIETSDAEGHRGMQFSQATLLPVGNHPGAFAVQRRYHVHEGVDLYCHPGEPVYTIEEGRVVGIEQFTGPEVGSPWWRSTQAILIEGESGVICYGEIQIDPALALGALVSAKQKIGEVVTVLIEDKGRPMTMLHLELHQQGTTATSEWKLMEARPLSLQDPTSLLRKAIRWE